MHLHLFQFSKPCTQPFKVSNIDKMLGKEEKKELQKTLNRSCAGQFDLEMKWFL